MNPNQARPGQTPGVPPVPPTPPQPSLADIPEDAFGFADETPTSAPTPPIIPNEPVARQPQPITAPPRPQTVPVDAQPPQPTPQPVVPAPPPIPPIPAQAAPAPLPDIMPPQKVPAVPSLTPPANPPLTPPTVNNPAAPTASKAPAPSPTPPVAPPPTTPTAPIKLGTNFDPSSVPVHASSTSENPITASYTPAPTTHIPEDIAKRIGEHPMQNSDEVLQLAKHGFDFRRLKGIASFLFFTAGIFIAAFLINQFIFQSYYVEGTSMVPTLQNNDRLIISKVERTLSTLQGKPYIPERGQIVVLDSSIVGINGQKEQLIKRVIGLPGDHLHIEKGTITITNAQNPQGFDPNQTLGLTNLRPAYSEAPIDLIVPAGHVYVMGDNREQGGSQDSRFFGPIESTKIQGRLWARILPLDKAQLF